MGTLMRRFAWLFVALLVGGCGPASVDGTVNGDSMDSSDAVAELNQGSLVDTLHVVIGGSTSDLCQDLSQGILHQGSTMLQLSIVAGTVQAQSYGIGTNISAATMVGATASKFDSACGDVLNASATGGTITLTKVGGSDVEGSFDLVFKSGHLTGTFTASLCANTAVDLKSCQ